MNYSKWAFICAALASIVPFFGIILLFYFAYGVSEKAHQTMLNKVLNAPINLYFDVTPAGTILNRFSKDLEQLDGEVFYAFMNLFITMFMAIAVFVISIIVNW